MKNEVSLKVSPSEFELKCSTRTGYSMSLGSKKQQPNMLLVLYDLMGAMATINENYGLRRDPATLTPGWKFQTVTEDGLIFRNATYSPNNENCIREALKPSEPLIVDGGVNFAGGEFKIDDPDCYHIWRATFFPVNYPMQPGGLMGIVNYGEGVAVADDGMVLPLDS